MKRNMYYIVDWQDASKYKEALDALEIPYKVESLNEHIPLKEGELAFVLPSIPIRQYVKVRVLFGKDAARYPI